MKTYTDTERLDYYEENSKDFQFVDRRLITGVYWTYYSPIHGKGNRKPTLREAIDATLSDTEEYLNSINK